MNSKCIDILAVNETRLNDTISSIEVTIPGYALERNDRNGDGMGVALYIQNTVEPPCATTSRKRPPPISDRQSKTPNVFQ